MSKVRITSFNLENLFNRYVILDQPWENRNYEKVVMAYQLVSIASRDGDLVSGPITEIQRNNTAFAILDSQPDILCVQEVENLYTLRNFNSIYLDDYFDRMILIDGNDPRGIDVGILLRDGFKGEIVGVRSHVDDGVGKRDSRVDFGYVATGAVFSRDCLEVDIKVGNKTITVLVNHFKAQDRETSSITRRRKQATKVAEFAKIAFDEGKYPIVIGDLNMDIKKPISRTDDSLKPLFDCNFLIEPFNDLPDPDRWTHYYPSDKKVSKLDYIFIDKRFTVIGVEVLRKGITTKCRQYIGQRYATIGQEHTEASDHCPITVEIDLNF